MWLEPFHTYFLKMAVRHKVLGTHLVDIWNIYSVVLSSRQYWLQELVDVGNVIESIGLPNPVTLCIYSNNLFIYNKWTLTSGKNELEPQ